MTVSYFEWVQDLNRDHWSEAVVNAKLKEIMVRAFHETLGMAQREEVNMRTAAYLLAVKRVADATCAACTPSSGARSWRRVPWRGGHRAHVPASERHLVRSCTRCT